MFSRDTTPTSAATHRGSNPTPDSSWSRASACCSTTRPVDPRRDERVVDVADRQDPRLEVELVAAQPARVAAAVEPLVMVEHEPADAVVEAAELVQELRRARGCCLTTLELVVVERAGLLQDRARDRELADVVQEAADRQAAEPRWGEAERSPISTASAATRRVCSSVELSFSASRTMSARTRAPRNASSAATSSTARRSPTSGREWLPRRRS